MSLWAEGLWAEGLWAPGLWADGDAPPGPSEFTPGIPRLAFRKRTGELFPLLLDADNVPYAYQRPGGGVVGLSNVELATGSAVADSGESVVII